jgi:hypothetical protein
MEPHGIGLQYTYERVKQALHLHTDRGSALREAAMAVRKAGTLALVGVDGAIDRFALGVVINTGITIGSAPQGGRVPAGRLRAVGTGAAVGVASGLAGAAAMAAASKIEQLVTDRPDSYVPAHTLGRLLGLRDPDSDRWSRNMAMHYASGAVGGALRGVMSTANLRGPFASLMHTNLRLSFDQTLENLTGAGAPPWTWPRDELLIDVSHKAVYSFVTGALSDALIPPAANSSARRRALGRRLKGFA